MEGVEVFSDFFSSSLLLSFLSGWLWEMNKLRQTLWPLRFIFLDAMMNQKSAPQKRDAPREHLPSGLET